MVCLPRTKISNTFASDAPNSLVINKKYCALHYLNITYHHKDYNVCTLLCELNVLSL